MHRLLYVFVLLLSMRVLGEEFYSYPKLTSQPGVLDVRDGNLVEGSSHKGGLQPDFEIDLQHPVWQALVFEAKQRVSKEDEFWRKIQILIELLRKDIFVNSQYGNPIYLSLLERYRASNQPIPLSEYIIHQAGTCREQSLALHLLLREIGIPSYYVYAKIEKRAWGESLEIEEDHAFVVVNYAGEDWTLDAYFYGFNGYLLKDMASPRGITASSKKAPIVDPDVKGFRRILYLQNFPRILNEETCDSLLGR